MYFTLYQTTDISAGDVEFHNSAHADNQFDKFQIIFISFSENSKPAMFETISNVFPAGARSALGFSELKVT